MKNQPTHYVDFIANELSSRKRKNPSYSLRAFSRDLNVTPGFLSKILTYQRGLSAQKAKDFAYLLDLDHNAANYFCDLVESRHGRSVAGRRRAKERLMNYSFFNKQMSRDVQGAMNEWYYLAILELTYLKTFQSSSRWIARHLGIGCETAEFAVKRLFRLNLLNVVSGKWTKSDSFIHTSDDIPSKVIQKLHTQFLQKSISCLQSHSVEQRDNTALVLTMSENSLQKYKALVREFRRKAQNLILEDKHPDQVYCLTTSFFPLKKVEND